MPVYAFLDDRFMFNLCGLLCATTTPSAGQRSFQEGFNTSLY
jgi:hypothetical protein